MSRGCQDHYEFTWIRLTALYCVVAVAMVNLQEAAYEVQDIIMMLFWMSVELAFVCGGLIPVLLLVNYGLVALQRRGALPDWLGITVAPFDYEQNPDNADEQEMAVLGNPIQPAD
jgi:hypothetical protein